MRFLHLNEVQEQYPNHYSGLMKVTDLTDVELGTHIRRLKQSIGDSVASQRIQSACDLWRRVFAKMGAKPKYRSSLEALFSYYMQKGALYSINDIVDFYNHYSLVHAIPMGAYDYNRFVGELKLSVIGKGKMFYPLGNVKSAQTTKDREVAYSDNEKVVCRYWNLQDCDQTKITNVTKDVLFRSLTWRCAYARNK